MTIARHAVVIVINIKTRLDIWFYHNKSLLDLNSSLHLLDRKVSCIDRLLLASLIPDLTKEELKGARVWEKVAEKMFGRVAQFRADKGCEVVEW